MREIRRELAISKNRCSNGSLFPQAFFYFILFFFLAEALPSCSFHVQTQRLYCIGSVQELRLQRDHPTKERPGLCRPVLGRSVLSCRGERRCKKTPRASLPISLPAECGKLRITDSKSSLAGL